MFRMKINGILFSGYSLWFSRNFNANNICLILTRFLKDIPVETANSIHSWLILADARSQLLPGDAAWISFGISLDFLTAPRWKGVGVSCTSQDQNQSSSTFLLATQPNQDTLFANEHFRESPPHLTLTVWCLQDLSILHSSQNASLQVTALKPEPEFLHLTSMVFPPKPFPRHDTWAMRLPLSQPSSSSPALPFLPRTCRVSAAWSILSEPLLGNCRCSHFHLSDLVVWPQ